ncbi:hypothetical protein [Arthrobacter sp. efr-133-R2A-120]|uniref:hypothetical protein n=1 Tax=Arthrobacter sp. efr-133-R2A-120 TaxID=3040277 RepID=UPI00254A588E|nr:hypothetical protein [Arthrobacter sp. efr-133-R2A-120]
MISPAGLLAHLPLDSTAVNSPWEWGWTAVGSLATGLAAIVTAITAVFIYFQTKETAKAASAGQHSADAANEALALTRSQQRQTLFIAAETVKNRVDATMPSVRVIADKSIIWQPQFPGEFLDSPNWSVPSGLEFNLPADGKKQILIQVSVSIWNEGPGMAHLRFNHPITNGDETLSGADLPQGQGLDEYTYSVQLSLDEWADIYQERQQGAESRHFSFEVTTVHPMDTGAVDLTRVGFGGTLVEPVPEKTGVWRLLLTPSSSDDYPGVGTEPTVRTYFVSRVDGRRLPDYPLQEAGPGSGPEIL